MFNLDTIIKVIIKLNVKEPYSFLTLTFPKPLNILHKNYPKLLQKFLKIAKLKDYIYVYEYKENNFHIHIICLFDYKENFFNLKNIWSTTLKESSTCRKYDCTNSLNYSEIRDINSSVYYIFKDFKLTEIAAFREKYKTLLNQKSRLFGGSSSFQRCFSDFRKILLNELSKLNDVLSDNFPQADNAFEDIFVSIKKEYILQNPEANEIFLKSQFENECNAYSCVLSQYNFTKFCEFVLSGKSCLGHHTLDFYHFLKDLLLSNNVLDLIKEQLETTFHSDYLKTKSPVVEEFLCKFFGYDLVEKKFNITFTTNSKSFLLYRIINIIYIIYRYQHHKRLSFIILRLADFMMVVVSSTKRKCVNTEYNINDRIRLGYFLFEFLRQNVFIKISDYLILHKIKYEKKTNFLNIDERSVYETSEFAESSLVIFEELSVFLEFTNLAKDQFFSKYKNLFLSATNEFTFHYPFLIAPKNWDFTVDLVSNNVEFNNATLNTTGGLLINNYLSHTSLCRVPPYTSHKLFITRRIVDLVNKIQSIPFCLDIDLYNLYISHKTELPDYLSNKIKILHQKKLYEINIVISKCYREMNELRLNSKLSVCKRAEDLNRLTILRDKTLGERDTVLGKLDKHRLLVRLLSYFENIKRYNTFYYYYFLDFRMRLYPCPVEVSYMGSKFARSLIRFSEKFPFFERAFKIYAVMQYIDCREKNEYEILSYFDSNLSLLLSDFENSFVFEKIRNAREPFLLLSCAVEWKRYQQHKNSGILEPYLSNFPIYLDCTSNGPQLISLLFALDSFAGWLNLVKQSPFDVRGDFYTSLIKKFLCYLSKTTIPPNLINIKIPVPVAVLAVLRKSLKSVIMTQFYGISFNKFSALIKSHFQKFEYRSVLIDYFIISPSDNKKISCDSLYREFIIFFVKEFWNFLHNQSFFQLKSILKTFHDLYYKSKPSSNKKKGPLYWSVFDTNKIFLHYNKLRKFQVDAKALKSRHQFVLYEQIKNELSSKQFSSLMANFIHSLDGYVLFRLLDSVNFPIMTVHDSFAVHSCHVDALKEKVREIFGDLVDNHKAFSYFIEQMSHILEEDLGLEVKDKFLEFVRTKIELGKLNKRDVLESYYCINYS